MKRVDYSRLYVWAGFARDEVPARIEMERCPVCVLLVEVTEAGIHREWHTRHGEEGPR